MGSEANNIPVRKFSNEYIEYLRVPFTYADNGKTLKAGVALPAGSKMIKPITGVDVEVAFNAGTTNVANVGILADTDKFGTALSLATIGFVPIDELVTLSIDVDTELAVSIALSGTAATAGKAEMIIAYAASKDVAVLSS